MPLPRVLICGDIVWAHEETKQLFDGIAEVVRMDSPDRADLLANLEPGGKYASTVAIYRDNSSADHIGVFNCALIEALPASVRWIAHNGAGYDQIDVNACKDRGIIVSNTPGAVDDATATTALYLLLSCFRLFGKGERSLRAGRWKHDVSSADTYDLTGKTLALVHAFPMRVVYHSRRPVEGAPAWAEYFGAERLDEFLGLADVLSVHVPLRAETEGLVIDEGALIRALEDGHLGAVGLDVYPDEPAVNPRLLEFPNATLLPHMGTETRDSQRKMEVRALTNARDYLTKGRGSDIVPELKDIAAKL
ncbi:hypothetical protein BC834DRAFT_926410 [Gloeopeniophorella convolvens]|nr:hypothetical protein BC834DRAFT_926410 [Gloeopeniophorella convolvens]